MEARARLLGHPIHQMLIVFPLSVLGMSLFFDLIAKFGGPPALIEAAYYMIAPASSPDSSPRFSG